jgi:SAM-dependent methyltransferase
VSDLVRTAAGFPYAQPIPVNDINDCYYYHTMDVPGHGVVAGQWDLRGKVDEYLGGVSVKEKRVLDIGTASGFLAFEMETRGAEVVGYDLSENFSWDIVPFAGNDIAAYTAQRREQIQHLNKSWWFNRAALDSHARVVYGTVYDIPAAIGPVDVCIFGSILLHVRDPFMALEQVCKLRPQTIVVAEPYPPRSLRSFVTGGRWRRTPAFVPDWRTKQPVETWWSFNPRSVENMLRILGFETVRVVNHAPPFYGKPIPMFTVVAERVAE